MSNAIANSFALLNEIKQELNQQRVIIPQRPSSKSPSPTKVNFSGLLNQGTTRPQDQRANSLHQNTRISKKEDISRSRLNNNIENNPPISNYYSDRNVPYQKKTMKNNDEDLKNDYSTLKSKSNINKGQLKSTELIDDLKNRIEEEIQSFSSSCDEITKRINELIKTIGKEEKEKIEEDREESDSSSKKHEKKDKNEFKEFNNKFESLIRNIDSKKKKNYE